jgi:hypothetical protein
MIRIRIWPRPLVILLYLNLSIISQNLSWCTILKRYPWLWNVEQQYMLSTFTLICIYVYNWSPTRSCTYISFLTNNIIIYSIDVYLKAPIYLFQLQLTSNYHEFILFEIYSCYIIISQSKHYFTKLELMYNIKEIQSSSSPQLYRVFGTNMA